MKPKHFIFFLLCFCVHESLTQNNENIITGVDIIEVKINTPTYIKFTFADTVAGTSDPEKIFLQIDNTRVFPCYQTKIIDKKATCSVFLTIVGTFKVYYDLKDQSQQITTIEQTLKLVDITPKVVMENDNAQKIIFTFNKAPSGIETITIVQQSAAIKTAPLSFLDVSQFLGESFKKVA